MKRNFGPTIARLGGDCLRVVRRKEGFYLNGRYVEDPNGPQELEVTGSVQVMELEELQMLPEGQRSTETRKFYTTERLYTVDVKEPNFEPDQVFWQDRPYEVNSIGDWQAQANYYQYVLTKAGQ